MDEYEPLYSEEDIRTKVVTTWLADHGFGPSDISVEYSFEIRLGRKILPIASEKLKKTASQVFRPRADILVRSCDGRNLLIVEVKAPNEPLDENVREQGICYARLLRKGGIAPFVVLTNGHETKIYDTVSEELINDTAIPPDHPLIKAGFHVSADDLALRAEALETFISLSPENLIEFCRQQVSFHMRFLRDEDPYSGKKYIPSLYVERQESMHRLTKLLDEKKQRVVIITGPPQVGKTNFICHTVEKYLEQGLPCLFYPAIGMEKGLLGEIGDDFEWMFGDGNSAYYLIHRKLQRILGRTGQRLTIFIDGWNEANTTLARTIDRESERLSGYNIACVISMTNVAAVRLLIDEAGNPSHVAEAAGINASVIPLLEISPEKEDDSWSKVYIGKYRDKEVKEAYRKYAEIFKVQVSQEHQLVEDPFLLRIGMEAYQGQVLPHTLDEPVLLERSISEKAKRAGDLRDKCVPVLLSELTDEMLATEVPLRQSVAMRRWGISTVNEPPKGLFEAAILTKVCDAQGFPSLDFYYSRERDFVVACWTRDWVNKLLGTQEAVLSELSLTSCKQIGIDALRWFLRQPKYESQLQFISKFFPLYENPSVKRSLLSSLCEIVHQRKFEDKSWINKLINEGVSDPNPFVKVEAAKVIIALDEEARGLIAIFDNPQEPTNSLDKLIANLLAIEENYPLEHKSVSNTVLDAIRHLHWEFTLDGKEEESEVVIILVSFMKQPFYILRQSAAKALGYISPLFFLKYIADQIKVYKIDEQRKADYTGGFEMAISELEEMYYGSMCPGILEGLVKDPDQLSEEYMMISKICKPVTALYSSKECGHRLLGILRSLQPERNVLEARDLPSVEQILAESSDLLALRYQLPLPFDNLNIDERRN